MKRNWKGKVSADCLRQLEYNRKAKEFYRNVPDDISELYRLVLKGHFNEFEKSTAELTYARAEHYETVELKRDLVEFVNSTWPGMPWGTLTAGQKVHLPPNAARIVREFETVMLLFEKEPFLRGMIYVLVAFFGKFAVTEIAEFAERCNLPNLDSHALNSAMANPKPIFDWLGGLLENIGKKLQGKPIPKGKVDREKLKLINFIRGQQTESLTWPEMREALEFGGVFFESADSLRVFAHRARQRTTRNTR